MTKINKMRHYSLSILHNTQLILWAYISGIARLKQKQKQKNGGYRTKKNLTKYSTTFTNAILYFILLLQQPANSKSILFICFEIFSIGILAYPFCNFCSSFIPKFCITTHIFCFIQICHKGTLHQNTGLCMHCFCITHSQ